jgi:hypothetical protein
MRRVKPSQVRCTCDAYHYPHRMGSGLCGNVEKLETFVHGPIPADADARAAAPLDAPPLSPADDSFAAWVDSYSRDAAE